MRKDSHKNFEEIILAGAKDLNLSLSPEILAKLFIYATLLTKWNKTYNLVSRRSNLEDIANHILDSLKIAKYVRGPLVLDVGSGAGFPGIPLALLLPQYKFMLLDSNNKKVRFLNHVLLTKISQNLEVFCGRVEKFRPRICFATIMSRATYSLVDMVVKTQQLLCHDGELLLMKGKYPLNELHELNIKFPALKVIVHNLEKKNAANERHLISIMGVT